MIIAECKAIMVKLAIRYGVPPKLIAERLLSTSDKEDMLRDLITFETLNCAVRVWKEYGMCDYSNGSMAYYERFNQYRATMGGEKGDRVAIA